MGTLYEGMVVIDDSNYRQYADNVQAHQGRGLVPRDFNKVPYGSSQYAPASPIKPIPRSDWSAMIKERKERRMMTSDLMKQKGIKVLNQKSLNYCWVFAVTMGIMLARVRMGMKHVQLSPASLGAKIKNGANVGGWGLEAVEKSKVYGIVPTEFWPDTSLDLRQYDTPESREIAKNYMVGDFYDIRPHDFDMMMTFLLLFGIVPAGHNWWSHEICHVDPVEIEPGHFGTKYANSWDVTFGVDGFGIMAESKASPDDAQGIMSAPLRRHHAA